MAGPIPTEAAPRKREPLAAPMLPVTAHRYLQVRLSTALGVSQALRRAVRSTSSGSFTPTAAGASNSLA